MTVSARGPPELAGQCRRQAPLRGTVLVSKWCDAEIEEGPSAQGQRLKKASQGR